MDPFTTALIKAPKRSNYDFSHDNTLSVAIGEGTPSLVQFIVPGDEVSMSLEQIVRVAPMPVPTFVPLKVRHDFHFVPLRLLYGQDYMDTLFGSNTGQVRASSANLRTLYHRFTGYSFTSPSSGNYEFALQQLSSGHKDEAAPLPGSLIDYLGYPVLSDRNGGLDTSILEALASGDTSELVEAFNAGTTVARNRLSYIFNALSGTGRVNVEPLFAYHFIWRDWYRFTGVEDNTIVEPYLNNGVLSAWNSSESLGPAYDSYLSSFLPNNFVSESSSLKLKFGDLGNLFFVHLKKDMFTAARYGNKPTVLIPTGDNGNIPALRQASAIQRFLDIISITGQRYFDKVKGLFGVEPQGPKDDRVQFLGRYQSYIKVGEVITTASTEQAETGDYAGRGILVDGKYIFNRRFTEHGWLFCITSVVPEISYSGLHRSLTDVNPLDTPIPSMAQVGDQSILGREISFSFNSEHSTNNISYGDQFRYYAYKSANNEVHGSFLMQLMRPWSPLKPFTYKYPYDPLEPSIANDTNVISYSKVRPNFWNYLFNDTSNEPIWRGRFFINLSFGEHIVRALPKYINYHL